MSEKKPLPIQKKEILMEQIRNYPCLYDKSKMSHNERDVNRNAWSKSYETVYTNEDKKR